MSASPCPPEVLYEDLQYLSVSALALAALAGLLMLAVWLLDKAYRKIVEWQRRRQMPGKKDTRKPKSAQSRHPTCVCVVRHTSCDLRSSFV